MKRKYLLSCKVVIFALFTCLLSVNAQRTLYNNKLQTTLDLSLVSSYQWRGQELSGLSSQVGVNIATKGIVAGIWSSLPLQKNSLYTSEVDLSVGYRWKNFYAGVTDRIWAVNTSLSDIDYYDFSAHTTPHSIEATIGYHLPRLTFEWNTVFAGADYHKFSYASSSAKRAYSTYISLTSPFKLGNIQMLADVGISPWKTALYGNNSFAVVNVGLQAFTRNLFAKIGTNPRQQSVFVVAGIKL